MAPLSPPFAPRSTQASDGELHEWITAEDVARLLNVRRSWVYEHTRARRRVGDIRLPYVKIGKYVRFSPRAIAEILERQHRVA